MTDDGWRMTDDWEWAVFGVLKRKLFEHASLKAIHARKREPLFAEVFNGCADVIEFFAIDEQKAIMNVLDASNFKGRILGVVLLQIESKAGGNNGSVNDSGDTFSSLGQLEQHRVVDIIIDENNGGLGAHDYIVEEGICIEELVIKKDTEFRQITPTYCAPNCVDFRMDQCTLLFQTHQSIVD